MKAIICFIPGSGGVHITSFTEEWTRCLCGQTAAKWEDAEAGRMVAASRDRQYVRGFGLNNQLLIPALTAHGQMWETFREWHDNATDAPGYIFDKSRAACWAIPFIIGSTSDSRWATPEEYDEAFPSDFPDGIVTGG